MAPQHRGDGRPACEADARDTTPCCDAARKSLEDDYEVVAFHATGSGGRALEKLVESGLLAGVLDLTTTEVADEVVGGVLTAGPERLDAIVRSEAPCVMSLGALDMVNFGGRETVPDKWRDRRLHVHNSEVTCIRVCCFVRHRSRHVAQSRVHCR